MKRILIDLTDLELWTGHHGGTQRVVYNISKYFYLKRGDLKQEIDFIAYSPIDNSFHMTDFSVIYDRVEAANNNDAAVSPANPVSRKAILKQRLRPYVPESVRKNQRLRQLAVSSATKSIVVARQVKGSLKSAYPKAKRATLEKVLFQPDDTVLIMGKPWDNLNIQKSLIESKSEVNFKIVQVVYDLIISLQPQLHHPSLFKPYTQNMFEAVSDSDLLLPISKSSANDLKSFCKSLKLTLPKVEVIRLGDEVAPQLPAKLARPDTRIDSKFIACVGTIEIRKNHMLLYYTYKLAQEQGIDLPQLVIVGGRGWLSGDLQYLMENDPIIKKKIIILDNVNDMGLRWIYENCLFTVYPSMYEGWGLPVAESLALGKVCLASNSSSVPEIAGDNITYFSPFDPADCLKKMVELLDPKQLYTLQENVVKGYKVTPWETTFKQVLADIERLHG